MVKWSIPGAFLSLTKDTYIFNTDTYVTYTCYIFMLFIYKNTRYDLLIRFDLLYFSNDSHVVKAWFLFCPSWTCWFCVTPAQWSCARIQVLDTDVKSNVWHCPLRCWKQTPCSALKGTNCTLNTSDFRPRNAEKQFISLFSRFAASSNSAAATSQQFRIPCYFRAGKDGQGVEWQRVVWSLFGKRKFLEDFEEAFWCLRKISSDFGPEKTTNISSESCCWFGVMGTHGICRFWMILTARWITTQTWIWFAR